MTGIPDTQSCSLVYVLVTMIKTTLTTCSLLFHHETNNKHVIKVGKRSQFSCVMVTIINMWWEQ